MNRTLDAGTWIDGLDQSLDLRRKATHALSTRVVERAHWLSPKDCELVLAYFERGMHASEIGTLLGYEPKYVRRRLKQLVFRLEDPRCAYVVTHRNAWTPKRRAIAEDLFIRGRSMREVSKAHNMSLHTIRKHRDAIEAMAQASLEERSPSRAWRDSGWASR